MSRLKDILDRGNFAITAEIGPPKGVDIDRVIEPLLAFKDRLAVVNVTDNQSSVMRASSLAASVKLMQHGIEPVFQLTCRDRNRLGLQSDALGAYALGIRNVLVLSGDHPKVGDHPQAKPVYDLDSVNLLEALDGLRQGHDMAGQTLTASPTEFFLGAAVSPESDAPELQLMKMEKKIRAGADFFQTQPVFNIEHFAKFRDGTASLKSRVIAGIILLKSPAMAKFMNENIAGIDVPENIIAEMASVAKEDYYRKSIEIAARLITGLKGVADGVHIMAIGWERHIPAVLDAAGM